MLTPKCRTALHHVQQRRFCIQPNDAFEAQLQEYEPIYQARVAMAQFGPARVDQVGKREREEEEEEEWDHHHSGRMRSENDNSMDTGRS